LLVNWVIGLIELIELFELLGYWVNWAERSDSDRPATH